MSATLVPARSGLDAWLDACLDRFGLEATLDLHDRVPGRDRAPPSAGSCFTPEFRVRSGRRGRFATGREGRAACQPAARGHPTPPRARPA